MAIITWDNSFSVGIEEFDKHHKYLVDLLNQLHDAMKAGKGNDVMGGIFKDLLEYTRYHFGAEEATFAKYGYAESSTHIAEHHNLVKQLTDLKAQFDAGSVSLSLKLMTFLRDWLLNHIKTVDKKYSAFLQSKGMK